MTITDPSPHPAGAWAPAPFRVVDRREEGPGVTTLAVEAVEDSLPVAVAGQFHMVWAFGIGEAPISVSRITGSVHEHTIAAVGAVSAALAALDVGDTLGLRGPFGTGWDIDDGEDRDLLVVAGGIGFAPVRPVVDTAVAGGRRTTLVVGARTPDGLLFADDRARWAQEGVEVHTTVDRPAPGWVGEVGLVTAPLARALGDPAATRAVVCGPEVMIRVTAERLEELGVDAGAIVVSLERNMQCGLGQCGRCQLGPRLLCRDGAVLPWPDAAPLLEVRGW